MSAKQALDRTLRNHKTTDMANPNVPIRDGNYLESLFAMAACVASHEGGVGEIAFPAFLSALVRELEPSYDQTLEVKLSDGEDKMHWAMAPIAEVMVLH